MKKIVKIIGLVLIVSFMLIFLGIWIFVDAVQGYTYFLSGEPNNLIKYTEWTLGLVGLLVGIQLLKEEIDGTVKKKGKYSLKRR